MIAPDLRVLFCGINPGLYTAWTGHHFARPGNRFWKVLHLAGFTDRQLHPSEQGELLADGIGITNFVARTTAAADELTKDEVREGARLLEAKVLRYRPRVLAILGVQAYRMGFAQPKAKVGPQPEPLGETAVWALPNPSGLQASYQLPDLVRLYTDLRIAASTR